MHVSIYDPGEKPHPRCRLIGVESASGKTQEYAEAALKEKAAERGANNIRLIRHDEETAARQHNGVNGRHPITVAGDTSESADLVGELYFCPDA